MNVAYQQRKNAIKLKVFQIFEEIKIGKLIQSKLVPAHAYSYTHEICIWCKPFTLIFVKFSFDMDFNYFSVGNILDITRNRRQICKRR